MDAEPNNSQDKTKQNGSTPPAPVNEDNLGDSIKWIEVEPETSPSPPVVEKPKTASSVIEVEIEEEPKNGLPLVETASSLDRSSKVKREVSPEPEIEVEASSTSAEILVEPKAEKSSKSKEGGDSCCVKDENGFTYYKCRFCGLTYNYMTTLKAHERIHDVETPYACNKCGESFHFMCELEYHAKQHTNQKGYKCECGRTFYQYTDLLYHKHDDEEDDEEPIPPPKIIRPKKHAPDPADFPTPEFMREGYEPKYQIKQYSDTRMKPYICQYCSKSYSDSRGLAQHMYSHRGERHFNPRSSRYLIGREESSFVSPRLLPSSYMNQRARESFLPTSLLPSSLYPLDYDD